MARILVVDDDKPIRELIKDILVGEGHVLDTAENGAEALERARAEPFDLVIMDRNMPVMTGIDALKALRSDPRLKELKVILCTSANLIGEIEEGFAGGATDYLIKPLKMQALIAKVSKVLAA